MFISSLAIIPAFSSLHSQIFHIVAPGRYYLGGQLIYLEHHRDCRAIMIVGVVMSVEAIVTIFIVVTVVAIDYVVAVVIIAVIEVVVTIMVVKAVMTIVTIASITFSLLNVLA